MKKAIAAVTMLMVLAIAGAAFSFSSTSSYSYGKADGDMSMAVVAGGVTIKAGQWVMLKDGDTQELDTGAVVTNDNSGAENSALVYGVAEDGGTGGAMIRVRFRGITTAYLNGADTSSAGGITQGAALSLSWVDGAAGSVTRAATGVGTSADGPTAAATKICGVALAGVASTDTGLYNRYSVLVTVR
jgi:hypothetical protein